MIQKRDLISIACLFMTIFVKSVDIDTRFEDVQKQYTKAMQQLINVDTSMKPPVPIQLTENDLIGAAYAKIIKPYVMEIRGYSNVVISAYARKFPYYQDLKTLSEKVALYEQKVVALTKLFPEKLQNSALMMFYSQLTDSLVQNCAKIVQDISYALNTDSQALDAAFIAYTLAWNAQTPTMKLTGFSDVATFKSNMTTWMANLYQAAIAKQISLLQKTKDRKSIYAAISSYYDTISTVFTNNGNREKAQTEKQSSVAIKKQEADFEQAERWMQDAQKQAVVGRAVITIDFVHPSSTKENLSKSLESLKSAQKLYEQALAIYTSQQDEGAVNECQARLNELNGDEHIRGMQLLWVLFLQNAYRTGSTSTVQSFSTLQQFYKSDPTSGILSSKNVVDALSDLLSLCTTTPNNFNTSLAIKPLLQSAITLYQDATAGHPHAHNVDRLADSVLLQEVQTVVTTFVALLQGMIAIAKQTPMASRLNGMAQLVVCAKQIDSLFAKNSFIKNMFFYFPQLESDISGKRSFVSFFIQFVYRLVISTISDTDDQDVIGTLSNLMTLQNYKDFLTADQLKKLQDSIVALAKKIDIEKKAEDLFQNAQKSNNWVNTAGPLKGYQSVTDSLWNQVIQWYEIMMQLSLSSNAASADISSTEDLEKQYAQLLQNYIEQFVKNAPTSVVGYQLHVMLPLYKLYLVGKKRDDTTTISFVDSKIDELFGQNNGFFGQIEQMVTELQASTTAVKAKAVGEQAISQLIVMINVAIEQQKLAMDTMVHLLQLSQSLDPVLESVEDNVTITVSMKFGKHRYVVKVTDPVAVRIEKLISTINQIESDVKQQEAKQDFNSVQTSYQNIQSSCLDLLKLVKSTFDVKKYKEKYFLAKTRYTAASLASQVMMNGFVTLDMIKDIPQHYYAARYQLGNVDMKLIGTVLPDSLKKFTTLTIAKDSKSKADALAIFKAYLLYQLLQQQGLNFVDCYSDYTLQKKKTITKDNMAIVLQAEKMVTEYMKRFDEKTVISVSVLKDVISFVIEHMPIEAITPLYATGPYAAVYFVGAADLFAEGKDLIVVGGQEYVPGQDRASYQNMLENVAYAYLSQAQQQLSSAQALGQLLISDLKKQISTKTLIDEDLFLKKYNRIKEIFTNAQALLFATDASAYYYFEQAQQNDLAAQAKEMLLGSYQTEIDIYQQLLIGDPVSNRYNTILSDINQAYISWSVELDPGKDADLIAKNRKAIVTLFKVAGDSCMNTSFIQPMFPDVQQYYYMQAASNYQAASNQYASMQDQTSATDMNAKALQGYMLASNQKVTVYYAAKKNGLIYTPANMEGYDDTVSTKPQKISFNDLFEAYQNFKAGGDINPGKTVAYTILKNLLLDAAMYYQFLSGKYAKQIKKPSDLKVSKDSAQKKSNLNAQLLAYLQKEKIIDEKDSSIPFVKQEILPQLFAKSNDVFVKFSTNFEALADWCNALNMAIAYQYIDDYQGGIGQTTSQAEQASEFQEKWQSFFTALQKESSALQNPSSAYVG